MSTRRHKARAAIRTIACALEGEYPPVMFVSGVTTALFALPKGVDVCPTNDVDCVVARASLGSS